MINREIYRKDPSKQKLVNEGVASVNDDKSEQAMAVLRYELETFVCNGQYKKGIEDILETYLKISTRRNNRLPGSAAFMDLGNLI